MHSAKNLASTVSKAYVPASAGLGHKTLSHAQRQLRALLNVADHASPLLLFDVAVTDHALDLTRRPHLRKVGVTGHWR